MSNIRDFAAAKSEGRKIVVATAYDATFARLLAQTPVDCLLVGDSVMMVVHGADDTLGATTEIMALHTRAVAKGAGDKFIVADFPFLAARKGIPAALDCAAELLRAGAHAVKVEGARGHIDTIRHLVESGIPVMGHLGLQPQNVRALGGYTVQGRAAAAAQEIREEAALLANAGVFALVLECVPRALAAEVTAALRIPTIGIGAGPDCDGQVLVLQDLLGLNLQFKPRFVRHFAPGAETVQAGVTRFAEAVRTGEFPAEAESFA